jgi:hypothetical protein
MCQIFKINTFPLKKAMPVTIKSNQCVFSSSSNCSPILSVKTNYSLYYLGNNKIHVNKIKLSFIKTITKML